MDIPMCDPGYFRGNIRNIRNSTCLKPSRRAAFSVFRILDGIRNKLGVVDSFPYRIFYYYFYLRDLHIFAPLTRLWGRR